MSDARPLLKIGSDVERTLLAAGLADRPAMASVRRAAKGVGLFPRVALVGIALVMAVRAARWTSVAAWSAVPLVGLVGLAIVSRETRIRPRAAEASPSDSPAPLTSAKAAVLSPALASAAALEDAVAATDSKPFAAASARSRVRSPGHSTSPSASVAIRADSLGEQSRLLDRARLLLASGDARSSLALLDVYDRRFAGKALREEALLLRIEALASQGDRAAALARSQQFARSYPGSVHGERLSALIHTLSQ